MKVKTITSIVLDKKSISKKTKEHFKNVEDFCNDGVSILNIDTEMTSSVTNGSNQYGRIIDQSTLLIINTTIQYSK